MPTLIERIMKVSVVAAFAFQSLASDSYPNCLIWVDIENLMFRLRCMHKKKKGWTHEVEIIFLDYVSFKTRKSVANGQGKRSVLLQALKASPYIEIDKSLSTVDEKICKFTEKFKKLLATCTQELENSSTSDSFVENSSTLNSFGSLLLQNTSEAVNELENSMVSSASGMNIPQTSYQSSAIALETAPTVPNVDMMKHVEDDQSSFYPEDGSLVSVQSHNSFQPNGGAGLQPEQSIYLPLSEESSTLYPPDYDPQEDLLRSQRSTGVSSNSAGDIYMNSPIKAKSSAIEILDVCGVERVGNGYRMLKDVGPDAPSSSVSPKFFMVTINSPTQ